MPSGGRPLPNMVMISPLECNRKKIPNCSGFFIFFWCFSDRTSGFVFPPDVEYLKMFHGQGLDSWYQYRRLEIHEASMFLFVVLNRLDVGIQGLYKGVFR